MYVVVMAGGGGTRLWPLSRPERPKPFLPLLGDETLLQATVRRLAGLDAGGPPIDVTVVTDQRYEQLVRAQLPDVRILTEPAGRNTAAAVALATVAVDRPDDDVMIVLPADHFILTTLAPRDDANSATSIPDRNDLIRTLASDLGVHLIDLAGFTSTDGNGATWKTSLQIGDGIHYTDAVRDWLAGKVVDWMASATPVDN